MKIIKIAASLILAGTMAFSTTAFALDSFAYFCKPGDVDGNNIVDVKDVTLLQKYYASRAEIDDNNIVAADFNGDGDKNIKDATEIQKMLANKEYNCGLNADNSYIKYTGITIDEVPQDKSISFTTDINTPSNLMVYCDEDNRTYDNEVALVTSKEQLFAITNRCCIQYDDDFFKESALIIWLDNDTILNIYKKVNSIGVDGNSLLMDLYVQEPNNELWTPNIWQVACSVKKADIKNVENIKIKWNIEKASGEKYQ